MNETKYGLEHGLMEKPGCLWHYQYGLPHNTNGPACCGVNDSTLFYQYGMQHNINEPAYMWKGSNIESIQFYQYGLLHNTNGPAYHGPYDDIEFYQYGLKHNQNGPSRHYKDDGEDSIQFFQYGRRHNTKGPAIIEENKEFYYKYGRKIKSVLFDKSNWKLGL